MRNELYRPMSTARIGMSNELAVAHNFGVILQCEPTRCCSGEGEHDPRLGHCW